ncbi:hypothetical protein PRZ48_009371 [Zasmidium cellare]|uniref:SET domain-containing protein n=1 Tax=Zasmidium cellare TaxID=395010 RepID=A0ABR0EC72_ZASCE|nr:hypothetical protein PRZ48_009371 [Zasmidium cellare]
MQAPGSAFGNYNYYMLAKADGKGRGAFALTNLKAGTKILVDKPLMVIDKKHGFDAADVGAEYQKLSSAQKEAFDQARVVFSNGREESTSDASAFDKFNTNKFSIDGKDKWGCFAHASRFNHSCLPNCHMSATANEGMQCHVIRDVAAGEELTFTYFENLLYLPTNQRRQFMAAKFMLLAGGCLCKLCTNPGKEQNESDARRLQMRDQVYKWSKCDITEGYGPPFSQAAVNGAIGYERCKQDRIVNPAQDFVDLAEEEGIVTSWWVRWACLWLAELENEKMGPDLRRLRRFTMRTQELLHNCKGLQPADDHDRRFAARIDRLKANLQQLEAAQSRS